MGNLALNNSTTGILTSKSRLDIISHNIANADDEDYSRQSAVVKSNRPLVQGKNVFGTGVNIEDVVRARDDLIEDRLRDVTERLGEFQELKNVFQQIETVLNEPGEDGMRGIFAKFNTSIQTLANSPENRGARTDMVNRAEGFVNVVKQLNSQIKKIAGGKGEQSTINQKLITGVEEVNRLTSEIATLNSDISTVRGRGGNPNDLLDERETLVKEMSKFIDTNVVSSEGKFRVTASGFTLVQNEKAHELSLKRENQGDKLEILYDDSNQSRISPEGGEIKSLIQLRDETIPDLVDELNDFTVQFVDRFNDLHKAGFSLGGKTRNTFFESLPTRDEDIFRLEGMGDLNGPVENKRRGFISDPEAVLTGNNETDAPENFEGHSGVDNVDTEGNRVGSTSGNLEINNSVIKYDMSQDSINDVINRINEADNNAEAYLSAENRLVIKGSQENNYELTNLEDSGLLLDKTNLLTVGGSDRSGDIEISQRSESLLDADNFAGDSRLDSVHQVEEITHTSTDIDAASNVAAGNNEFKVDDVSNFSDGDEVRISDNSDSEIVEVTNVDSGNSELTVVNQDIGADLANSYNPSNAKVEGGKDAEIRVPDASVYKKGDTISINDDDSPAADVQVVGRDTSSRVETITINSMQGNFYTTDQNARITGTGDDPARGRLEFESTNSEPFHVDYNAREDSVDDIVTRIVNTAESEESKISAEVTENDQLRLFASKDVPQSVEMVNGQTEPGPPPTSDNTIQLNDVKPFEVGDTVRLYDNNSAEQVEITSINSGTGEIEVANSDAPTGQDLQNNYDPDNGEVQILSSNDPDANFKVDDMAGPSETEVQQLQAPTGNDDGTTINVSNISRFSVGQEIEIYDDNEYEKTRVSSLDTSTDQITVDLANDYQTDEQATIKTGNKTQIIPESSNPGTISDDNKTQIEVDDASKFDVGDTVEISDDQKSETTTITSLDESNDEVSVDLRFKYDSSDGAKIKREGTRSHRNLLNVLGVDRKYDQDSPSTEFAITGDKRRPGKAEQVEGFDIRDEVKENPDLIAAAQGTDINRDGIPEGTNGKGDGSNATALSNLWGEKIIDNATTTPDEHINKFITDIGGDSAFAKRELDATKKLERDVKQQRQRVSGVSLDEELTKMIKNQQLYQASARMIGVVQQVNQSLLNVV